MAYVTIDGVKLEKELLELAKKHTTGRGESRISKEEAQELIDSAKDGVKITDTEMATLKYIRENFTFTAPAAEIFDEVL